MKRIISLLVAVVMIIGCMSALSSCGKPKDGGAKIDVYLGNGVYDFDPSDYYGDSNQDQLMSLLYEPLFSLNEKGKLEKAGAKKYKIDEEKNEIVIELRETYWSDDTRVKAQDYVYAWCERILNPNNPNPSAPLFYDIENAAAAKSGELRVSDIGVRATDVYELTIRYRKGADPDRLLKNLASVSTAPLRQDIVSQASTYWSKNVTTMVFNGPFKVRKISNAGGELTLERNRGFHQDPFEKDYTKQVTPEMLVGFVTPSGSEIKLSYSDIAEKTVFYMGDASLTDRAENKANAIVGDDTSVYSYVFNTENPLFKDARVRKALSVVIDREAIVEAITFGKVADGFLPDICGGSDEALVSSDDKALAEELLAEVDFTGLKKSFTLKIEDSEESKKIAELVVASWKTIGFNVKVETVPTVLTTIGDLEIEDSGIQVLLKEASYGNRNFDVLALDWQLYTTDAFTGLASFATTINGCGVDFKNGVHRKNISGWTNLDYNFLISEAMKSEGEERQNALKSAEKILMDESPIIPIVFNQTFAFVSKDVKKIDFDGFGNIIFTDAKQKNYREYLKEDNE